MRRAVIWLLFFILLPSPLFGEEQENLSLQEALRLAYEGNPRILEARQEVEAAEGRWKQGRTLPNPEVEVSVSELPDGFGKGSTVGDDSISLSQEIDLLGKFRLRGGAGQAEHEASRYRLRRVWSEVAFSVTQAYNNLLLSAHRVGVAGEVLTMTRSFFDQVQLRYNSGEVLRNELLRSQVEAAKAENAVLEAEKQVALAAATLNLLLGRDAPAPIRPIDEFRYQPQDFDPDQLLVQALAQRPDLKAGEEAIKAQRQQWQLAMRNVLDNPTVSAIGTRERSETGTEQVVGLAVRWPIPFWNRNQGSVQEAHAEMKKREIAYDALKREVGLEVISAVAQAQLAQRQLTVWKTGVDQANELMRVSTQQYREGDINFLTYLEHLAAAREAKVAYIQALANYRTQLALLNQAVANTLQPTAQKEVDR